MRVLVTGAGGQLGTEVVADLERRAADVRRGPDLEVFAADRAALDVARRDSVLSTITELEPDVVIHTAAWTAVDACEADPERAFAVNALGSRHVAEAARLVGAHVCGLSTDYVFDGTSPRPYVEWDPPSPVSVYGRSKLGGERELAHSSTIVRTAWVCGLSGANMARTVLGLVARGGPMRFVDDQRGTPTVASDLARVVNDLALRRLPGVFHVTNAGATTWFGFARAVVEAAGGDPSLVEPVATAGLDPPRAARRPANSVLANLALGPTGIEPAGPWEPAVRALVVAMIDRG